MAPKITRGRPLTPDAVQRGLSLEPGEDTWGAVEDRPASARDAETWAGFEGAGISDAILRTSRERRA